jgi:hypothetical protein
MGQVTIGRNFYGDIILLIDDGPSPELDAALTLADCQGDSELATWARERLSPTCRPTR